jgi:hypothetical protein
MITAGSKLLKGLDETKVKGNFLGKAKAFASKLGKTLGSEDESVEVFEDKDVYAVTGADVSGELRGRKDREREAAEAAAAEQKKKMTTYIMIGVAVVLFMFIKKK